MALDLPRRKVLRGLGSLIAAPAIVHIANIMPIRTLSFGTIQFTGGILPGGLSELAIYKFSEIRTHNTFVIEQQEYWGIGPQIDWDEFPTFLGE